MPKNKFYVVWKGRKPGIYASWPECQKQILRFKDPRFKGFPNLAQAEAAFADNGLKEGMKQVIWKSWSVDAACEGNPGLMEYQCVETETGKLVFHQGPFPNGTNNIGEFLAIVHALVIQQEGNLTLPIYSDSRTALAWLRKKKAGSKLPREKENEQLWHMLDRAVSWLKENEVHVPVLKWETDQWGEIPADFGRK